MMILDSGLLFLGHPVDLVIFGVRRNGYVASAVALVVLSMA